MMQPMMPPMVQPVMPVQPMMPPVGGIREMPGCLEFIVILIYSIILIHFCKRKINIFFRYGQHKAY